MIQHNVLRYSVFLVFIFWVSSFSAYSQSKESSNYLSAGLRFHNPFGISFKKYWKDNALEMVVGRANPWRYNGYYRFRNRHEKNGYHYTGFDPIYRPLVAQVHFMKQRSLAKIPQLSIYYGGGAQIRNYNYYLNYTYENGGVTHYESFREHDLGIGMDVVAGVEFKFRSIPLVLFYDLTLYTEAIQTPFFMTFDSGWGMRYYW